mgnify:CR=1 FL=1
MNNHLKVKLLLSFIVFTNITSQAQSTWDLQKCIDYAIENNIDIKRQQINAEYSKNEVKQAKDDKLPTFNAYLENDYSFGRSLTYDNTYENINSTTLSGTLTAEWTLFNGKTLCNKVAQTKIDLEATLMDLEKAKDDITLSVFKQKLLISIMEIRLFCEKIFNKISSLSEFESSTCYFSL